MFNDLLVKADQQKGINEIKKARKEEVLNLFKSLAEKAKPELDQIFGTVKILTGYNTGSVIIKNGKTNSRELQFLSKGNIYCFEIDIYGIGKEPFLKVGSGSPYDKIEIPFFFDMTNTQLTILYNNALRAMVARALKVKILRAFQP